MRLIVTVIMVCCFASTAGGKSLVFPVPEQASSGLYGFKNQDGQMVIAPRFHLAGDFSAQGIAPVVDDKGWAYIDLEGQVLLRPFVFDNGPDPFSEGLARYVEQGKIGFFNEQGQVAIPARFRFAEPFVNGLAAFCEGCKKRYYGEHWSMEGGRWGCIDHQGQVVRQPVAMPRGDCEGF